MTLEQARLKIQVIPQYDEQFQWFDLFVFSALTYSESDSDFKRRSDSFDLIFKIDKVEASAK